MYYIHVVSCMYYDSYYIHVGISRKERGKGKDAEE
jgi:hypothetical protein